ncbi:o-succinylbenzoate--CoA ligase, partial [Streptomyces sp. ZEA17I]
MERLRHIVASVLELDLVEVTAGASFQHDLKMDSLEKVEFAARVEWAFGVALSDEEASGIDSARAAAVLLESRLPPAAGAGGTVPEAGGTVPEARVAVPEAARSAGVRTAPSPTVAAPAGPSPLSS